MSRGDLSMALTEWGVAIMPDASLARPCCIGHRSNGRDDGSMSRSSYLLPPAATAPPWITVRDGRKEMKD